MDSAEMMSSVEVQAGTGDVSQAIEVELTCRRLVVRCVSTQCEFLILQKFE